MVRKVSDEDTDVLRNLISTAPDDLVIVTTELVDGTDIAVVAKMEDNGEAVNMYPLAILITDDIFDKIVMPSP